MLIVVLVTITNATSISLSYNNKVKELESKYNVKERLNPNNKERAYATLVSSERYLMGALALYKSILSNGGSYDLILVLTGKHMEEIIRHIEEYDYHDSMMRRIRLYITSYIDNPNEKIPESRFRDTYNKLHLWKLDQYGYKKLLFVDADCITFENVDLLFNCNGPVCAGPDMGNNEFFNGGVMVMEPNTQTYHDMIDKMGKSEYKSYDGGEQGFLNLYFDYPHKSIGWYFEKEIREAKTEEERKEIIEKANSDDNRKVYRLSYPWNTEVPLYYFFRYAWKERLGGKTRVIHFNLPIKPFDFLSFPILDMSYEWYRHFIQVPQYTFLPLPIIALLTMEVIVIALGFSLSKLIPFIFGNTTTITNHNILHFGLFDIIQSKVNRVLAKPKKKGTKRNLSFFERLKGLIVFTLIPILIVLVTALTCFLFYFFVVQQPNYDPHMQWFTVFSLITSFSFLFLSIYTQFIKSQARNHILLSVEQNQLGIPDSSIIEKKMISYFKLYIIGAIILPTLNFFTVTVIIYLTRGYFVPHVVLMVIYGLTHVLLIFYVLKNLARQTIYGTLKELLKV
ncbi:hypothetical protein ABK040_006841 [Willaertia magna]